MFCTKCGIKLEDKDKFCVSCGQKVGEDPASENDDINHQKFIPQNKRRVVNFLKRLKRIALLLVLICIVLASSVASYEWYRNLPREVDRLDSIALGMKPVEVTLEKGKPETDSVGTDSNRRFVYKNSYDSNETLVRFADQTGEAGVITICSSGTYQYVLGISKYDSLEKVIDKLGTSFEKSIDDEGVRQAITYPQYNAAFIIRKGEVEIVCVTSQKRLAFTSEYEQ